MIPSCRWAGPLRMTGAPAWSGHSQRYSWGRSRFPRPGSNVPMPGWYCTASMPPPQAGHIGAARSAAAQALAIEIAWLCAVRMPPRSMPGRSAAMAAAWSRRVASAAYCSRLLGGCGRGGGGCRGGAPCPPAQFFADSESRWSVVMATSSFTRCNSASASARSLSAPALSPSRAAPVASFLRMAHTIYARTSRSSATADIVVSGGGGVAISPSRWIVGAVR